MPKFKILFDASIFAQALLNINIAFRSGIFFTAFNILHSMCKRKDLQIYIFTNDNLDLVKGFLKQEFPHYKFQFLSLDVRFYSKIVIYRNKCKKAHKILQKHLLKLALLALSPIKKLIYFINLHTTINAMNSQNAYFSPCFKKPDFIKLKAFILLHDVTPIIIDAYKDMENKWFKALCESLNERDIYFTNSEATKNDFLKFFPQIPKDHIYTTLLATNSSFKPASKDAINLVRKKYQIPSDKGYIFSLCTIEPRKNLIRQIRCFIEFIKKNDIKDLLFVLGGAHWDDFLSIFEKEIENFDKQKILKIGYVADEDLSALYSGAKFFVYTSQYEGFGLPVLEAMSCGAAVITSNNSSLPEVIGDAGICIDFDSDTQHIKAYERLYFDEKEREKFAKMGLERAKNFSWDKCADIMVLTMKKFTNFG